MAQTKYGEYIITQTKPNYVPEFFGPPPENVESFLDIHHFNAAGSLVSSGIDNYVERTKITLQL